MLVEFGFKFKGYYLLVELFGISYLIFLGYEIFICVMGKILIYII